MKNSASEAHQHTLPNAAQQSLEVVGRSGPGLISTVWTLKVGHAIRLIYRYTSD